MSVSLELTPLSPAVAGQARLQVRGWQGPAPQQWAVQRLPQGDYLHSNGDWQASLLWLPLPSLDEALQAQVQQGFYAPLLATGRYQVSLRHGPDTPVQNGPLKLAAGVQALALNADATAPGAATLSQQAPARSGRLLLLLMLLIVVAMATAMVQWAKHNTPVDAGRDPLVKLPAAATPAQPSTAAPNTSSRPE